MEGVAGTTLTDDAAAFQVLRADQARELLTQRTVILNPDEIGNLTTTPGYTADTSSNGAQILVTPPATEADMAWPPLTFPGKAQSPFNVPGSQADASSLQDLLTYSEDSSSKVLDNTAGVDQSETTNALSNLGTAYPLNNENVLKDFGPQPGFSAVYNPASGRFIAYPSGETVMADGAVPVNLVSQFGGHAPVNQAFSELLGVDPSSNFGFSFTVELDGQFRLVSILVW